MAINKIVYGDQTLIDLTSDTATVEDVVEGKTFHDASGQLRTGSGGGGGGTEYGYLSFNYTYGSNATIYGNQITPNEDITIKGLRGFTTADKSGSLRIGTTSSIIKTIENVSFIGGQWTKADLSAPMTLTAGTTYIIQVVTSGGSGTIAYTQSSSSVAINSKITNTGVARHGGFPGNTEENVWVGVDIVISTGGGSTPSAEDVSYDNSGSGLSATDVQNALDEIVSDIPTVNDGTLTIQQNGETKGTFTANQSGNSTVNIEIPTADIQTAVDEFETYNGGLLSSCKVALSPIQDLHGYDHPWVGGAGKNKAYNVIYSNPTAQYYTAIEASYSLEEGKRYIFSFMTSNTGETIYRQTTNLLGLISASEYSFVCDGNRKFFYGTASQTATFENKSIVLKLQNDGVAVGLCSEFMVEPVSDSTTTPSDYEPYENICPISGHTHAEVDVSDGQTTQEQITVNLGGTYYSGILDIVSGVFVADKKTVDLGSLNWVADDFYKTSSLASEIKIPTVQNPYVGLISSILKENSVNNIYDGEDGIGVRYSTVPGEIRLRYTGMPTVLSDFVASVTGQTLCYPLATPLTIQLTPQQVKALVGENHLSAPLDGQEITESKYKKMFTFDDVIAYIQSLSTN